MTSLSVVSGHPMRVTGRPDGTNMFRQPVPKPPFALQCSQTVHPRPPADSLADFHVLMSPWTISSILVFAFTKTLKSLWSALTGRLPHISLSGQNWIRQNWLNLANSSRILNDTFVHISLGYCNCYSFSVAIALLHIVNSWMFIIKFEPVFVLSSFVSNFFLSLNVQYIVFVYCCNSVLCCPLGQVTLEKEVFNRDEVVFFLFFFTG